MKYRVGARYSDPYGSGVFFINEDNSVSFGPGLNNILLEKEEAEARAKLEDTNHPGKTPWEIWPEK